MKDFTIIAVETDTLERINETIRSSDIVQAVRTFIRKVPSPDKTVIIDIFPGALKSIASFGRGILCSRLFPENRENRKEL